MSDYEDNSEIDQVLDLGCSKIIPEKSKDRYEKTYKVFREWCQNKNCPINEKMLVIYFVLRSNNLKSPGSLWAVYSMLKSTIFLYDAIDISKFTTLIAFLRRKNFWYTPRKASVFTKEDVTRFLNEAPDEAYLILKRVLIFGISGACRREELYQITINDIEDCGTYLIVKVPPTKTNVQRTFTIISKPTEAIHY